jgi:hypothetical protein
MALAARVWGPGEPEPPEGVLTHLTSAPPNWFREEPAYAAELYALERGAKMPPEYTVYVRDVNGVLHLFKIRAALELVVRVSQL